MEVLDNLISNAVKYTDKGRIDVKARFDEKNIM
jgi:signal transduction histidine kinase